MKHIYQLRLPIGKHIIINLLDLDLDTQDPVEKTQVDR